MLGGSTFGIMKLFPPYDDKIPTTKTIYIEDGSSETIDDGYAWKSSIFDDDKNARLKKYYPYEKTKLGNFQRKVEYKNLKIDSIRALSEGKHLKLTLKDNNYIINAIGFNIGYLANEYRIGDKIDVAGVLEINTFNGVDNLQINIKDIMKSI